MRPEAKALDAAHSRRVLVRDGWRCRRCGARDGVQCHHLVRRRVSATRWDADASMALCVRCHDWYHKHPAEGRVWAESLLGPERWAAVLARSRSGAKRRDAEEEART